MWYYIKAKYKNAGESGENRFDKEKIMPNIKSQVKRVDVTRKENSINTAKRSRAKSAIKKFEAAITAKDKATATALLPETFSILDAARSDGIYHINTVARKKARLAKLLDGLK